MRDVTRQLTLLATLGMAFLCAAGCATGVRPRHLQNLNADMAVGSVRIDPALRVVVVTGFVNQVSGHVELLACGPRGKRHESVFVIQAGMVDIQASLLLVGCKAGKPMPGLGMSPPDGSAVRIYVSQGGSVASWRAAGDFLTDADGRRLRDARWIFTGSVIEDGKFKALAEESVIATYWDPWAILNIDLPVGRDDDAVFANQKEELVVGESVTFYIVPEGKP